MSEITEKIRRHLAQAEIADGLNLLDQIHPDAVMLLMKYKTSERHYNLGVIEYADYALTCNQVTFSAKSIVEEIENSEKEAEKPKNQAPNPAPRILPATKNVFSEKTSEPKKYRIFLSYSQADESLKKRLDVHFSALKRSNKVAIWHEGQVLPGEEAEKAILENLSNADIILLLVSADFIADDRIWAADLTLALARHEEGSAKVVPIILKPCDWSDTPFFKLAPLPAKGTPISAFADTDGALQSVVQGIKALLV